MAPAHRPERPSGGARRSDRRGARLAGEAPRAYRVVVQPQSGEYALIPHIVSASAEIAAPAERVYRAVADYREGHPRIIPKPPFVSLEVEQGGYGAGTVIRCTVHVAGMQRAFRAAVTEPDPGRILVETDLSGGPETTFTCEPLDAGRTRATITTRLQRAGRPIGIVERWLTLRFLRRVYREELRMLAAVATEADAHAEGPAG
jgi:hypothetical protein